MTAAAPAFRQVCQFKGTVADLPESLTSDAARAATDRSVPDGPPAGTDHPSQ